MKYPKFCVLLATYNGANYLDQQVQSIMNQDGVDVKIIASDDMSDDGTQEILDRWSKRSNFSKLNNKKLGSAATNFFRLILDADIGNAEFISLSDQDDVWFKDKLIVATHKMAVKNVLGYSSSFISSWSDGRKIFIDKSYKMKKYDYLFESPGPGNTFVLKKEGFLAIKQYLIDNKALIKNVPDHSHDWFIYAFFRYNNFNWYIDSYAPLFYRQHQKNVIGVNYGIKAIRYRFQKVFNYQYFEEVSKISSSIKCDNLVLKALNRFSIKDRFYLFWHAGEFRRKKIDVIALSIFFLFVTKSNK